MRTLFLVANAVGALGCASPPVDAPEEIGALGRFLFDHFDDEDPAELNAGWRNLATWLSTQDLDQPADDAARTMPPLDEGVLGGLGFPAGSDPADQVSVAVFGSSAFPVDEQVRIAVDPNQTCLESDLTVWAGRQFTTDAACFAGGDCDRLETLTEVRREFPPFVAVWYDQFKTYRRFTVPGDEGDFELLAGRAWIDERFEGDGGGTSMDILFHLDVYVQEGDRTQRWFAMWSAVSGLLIGRDAYANLVVNGLEEALLYSEEYLAGAPSSCPHDRDDPRPERDSG